MGDKLRLVHQFVNCTDDNLWFSVPDQLLEAKQVTTFESVIYQNKITPVDYINTRYIDTIYIVNGIKDAIKLAKEVDVDIEKVYEPCREEMKKAIWRHLSICYKFTSLRSVGTFTKLLMKGAKLFGTRNACGLCVACVREDSCASTRK